jgi:hypothetical protein
MRMAEMRVVPRVSIGPVRLGMTHAEVSAALAGHEIRGQGSRQHIPGLGLALEYTDSHGVIAFIQADSSAWVEYAGLDGFATAPDEVIARVVAVEGLNPADSHQDAIKTCSLPRDWSSGGA